MKIQRSLFWYLLISTIFTFFNGIIFPVVPLSISNFMIVKLMYRFYCRQGGIFLILFISAIGLLVLTAIMIKKTVLKRKTFWSVFVLTNLLYVLDAIRNSYYILLACTPTDDPGKMISITIFLLVLGGDLTFIVLSLMLTKSMVKKRKAE